MIGGGIYGACKGKREVIGVVVGVILSLVYVLLRNGY